MADEIPSITPENKGQTVRINPSSDSSESLEKTSPMGEVEQTGGALSSTASLKGQTVRISIPASEPSLKREAMGTSQAASDFPKKETTQIPTSLPTGPKPILPPPPIAKPMAPGIPKPPVAGVKPTIPSAPMPPVASPKKETARIQIPPQPKTPLHKATVKLEQPRPASMAPAASIAVTGSSPQAVEEKNSGLALLSGVLLAISIVAAAISFAVYSSASL